MKINYKKRTSERIRISEKSDAEFINDAVFRTGDLLKKDTVFYKSGLLFLSGNNVYLENEMKKIDYITGVTDSFILKNDMKKALLYAALLRRKVLKYIDTVNRTEIVLPASN